jgi:hypothetical protein
VLQDRFQDAEAVLGLGVDLRRAARVSLIALAFVALRLESLARFLQSGR